jgi:hypothetical protein
VQLFAGCRLKPLRRPYRQRPELLRQQIEQQALHTLLPPFLPPLAPAFLFSLQNHRADNLVLHQIDHASLLHPLVHRVFNFQYAR